ncbi:Uncharacterized protein KF715C_ch7240 [Pseudomonas putida]|uniref:Uncharacterized protein n=1 Tax=Pseudomonas putida TaxID=303 RepID=A0A1L7N736_PSEPU|nr:Uncharacterized protein KF715C_ch7240 [Pseudomonas putida]
MTWGEDWRAEDEVSDMALVGRRDGRNFGYGRQLSYAGPQALKDMFGGGHYGTVKAHVIGGRHSSNGVVPNRDPVSMMRGKLIEGCWPTMQLICATLLGVVNWLSAPHRTAYPALTGPWRRFAVISA